MLFNQLVHVPAPAIFSYRKNLLAPNEGQDPLLVMGVELEVEDMPVQEGGVVSGMSFHKDGSLRNNGAEYVTQPMVLKDILYALGMFFKKNKISEKNYSERCSIHVHVNIGDMTIEQIKTALLVYSVVERLLFAYVSPAREKNIFCVPIHETQHGWSFLCKDDKAALLGIWKRWKKYTALNLLPMFTQGTVEFRHMHGTHDLNKITEWLKIINSLFAFAKTHVYEEIKATVAALNSTSYYHDFVAQVFNTEASALLSIRNVEELLEEGVIGAKLALFDPNTALKKHPPTFEDMEASVTGNSVNVNSVTIPPPPEPTTEEELFVHPAWNHCKTRTMSYSMGGKILPWYAFISKAAAGNIPNYWHPTSKPANVEAVYDHDLWLWYTNGHGGLIVVRDI